MNSNAVTVSVSLLAFTPCLHAVLVEQGYSYSALRGDINADLGKASIRDQEQKTGATRYSKKADETVTSGSVAFKAVNGGTSVPLQFKAFNDDLAKMAKKYPSMQLGKDFVFPAQFKTWMDGKRVAKTPKTPKTNGKTEAVNTTTPINPAK